MFRKNEIDHFEYNCHLFASEAFTYGFVGEFQPIEAKTTFATVEKEDVSANLFLGVGTVRSLDIKYRGKRHQALENHYQTP